MTKLEKGPRGLRRGRGARERIVSASQQLFRDQGINCTGMDQLCAVAAVSKRTLYQHFTGKDELIAECLSRFDPDILPEVFDRTDLAPRERLLAAFDVHAPLCPFIAAAVEIPDPGHPARVHARDYKKAFAARLTDTAREAGATNPEQLGEQLALLLDGASARSRVLNTETLATAAAIAAVLVDKAIPTAAVPLGAGGNPSAGTGRVPDAATSSAEVDAEWVDDDLAGPRVPVLTDDRHGAVEQHGEDDDDAGRGGAPRSGRGAIAEHPGQGHILDGITERM